MCIAIPIMRSTAARLPGDMGSHDDLRQVGEWVASRALIPQDVQTRSRQLAAFQRASQSRLVYELARAGVDEECSARILASAASSIRA